MVLVAWQGIKVNERAGATYYFNPLGFYLPLARSLARARALAHSLPPSDTPNFASSLFVQPAGHVAGPLLAKIRTPAARGREKKRRERRWSHEEGRRERQV